MRLFFKEMLNYNLTITVTNPFDDNQIQLVHDAVPTLEEAFKKYFTVTNDTCPMGTKPHIIVGCHLMSECTVQEIKFDTTKTTKFLDWLQKEKIFIEFDSLGIKKTTTVSYLTKIHPRLTNHTSLKLLLLDLLNDVVINLQLACKLDPSLEPKHIKAMLNGDIFIPEPPHFEIYKTRISCSCDKDQVKTDVIGIKCAIDKGRLLNEFFTQSSNPMELTRLGMFIPTGAVHMIGTDAYAKLL